MAVRATLRRSGRHMVTVRPRFDLDINEMIDRITHQILDRDDELPTTRDAAMAMVREHCREHGNGILDGLRDDIDDFDDQRPEVADTLRELFGEIAAEIVSDRAR